MFKNPPSFPERSNLLFINADIATPSYFAGQRVNFLDVLPMPHIYSKSKINTVYKRISKTHIQDISIRITDQNGDHIKFKDDSEVFVILHFRKI